MTIFVSGGAKCGKSTLAQQLALTLAMGEKHYYVATMISSGKEDDARIRRHIADRAGMGFETVECFQNILDCLDIADQNGTFLVDSVTSLMQNTLFPPDNHYEIDFPAAKRCREALAVFAKTVKNAVFVSDYIYADAQHYDKGTETYRKCLADADRLLASVCDTVVEVAAGQNIIHKGALPL